MLPGDLLRPDAWPEPRPGQVELIETHISWVLRGEREVLKVKKPVTLGFLDYGTLALRRAACEDELRLNARLSPDVYRGLLPLVRRADGAIGAGEGDAKDEVVEWAVRMRRLPDDARADVMLAAGRLTAAHVDLLAQVVARFHAQAAVSPEVAGRWASLRAVEQNVRENFEQTRGSALRHVGAEAAAEAERRQLGFLRDHGDLFARRLEGGHVRDGHGDLRLEHVYLEDAGVRVIDCVEFDPRYRISDTSADVAFLAMDLEAQGRADLAERFLARYAREADDADLYAHADFYAGYRAWVRGKVSAIRADDETAPEEARRRAAADARRHFLLALASARPPLVGATLVCVGGLIAAGKSTIAEALGDELSCPVFEADRTRKRMLGVEATRPLHDPAWAGAYDPGFTERVYAELLRRAEVVLGSGRPVVLDASFRSASQRAAARALAARLGVPLRVIECRAPADVCRRRLAVRAEGPSTSDGRAAIFDDFVARYEAVTELAPGEHVPLDTTRPLALSLREIREHVATWPRGLVG